MLASRLRWRLLTVLRITAAAGGGLKDRRKEGAMTRKLIFTSILAVAAVSLAVGAAGAQDREGNGRRRESSRAVQQGTAVRRQGPPRAASPASEPRQQAAVQATPRGSENRSPAYRSDTDRGYAQAGGGYRRYDAHAYVVPRDFHPYRPLYFSRPYYGFRPHVHLGFGIWLGVPVPYPWAYFGAYVPRVYGYYYNQGYYGVTPGVPRYGGLSFDIQPYDAGLFVDGEYVGTVGTFTPYGEPLTLWPGVHHIAIVRDGFRTMEWDVMVEPGQVIPYRGAMERF
jgi:hypothetical protein